MGRLRVLTWHVHGSYLWYLSFAGVDWYVPERPGGARPWPESVRAVPGEVLVFPTDSRLHALWNDQCVSIVLSIAKDEFERELPGRNRQPLAPLFPPKLDLSGGAGRSFVNVLGCLCADCDLQQFADSSPVVRQSLQQALLLSLLQMSSASTTQPAGLENASTRRRRPP